MRGITLEEISAATKISVRFLKSIENEEFSTLPGGIFRRSFVRAYARYLGLDEDPLIEEYQLAVKTKVDVDLSQFSPPSVHARQERPARHKLWVAIIAVTLLAFGFTQWRHSRRSLQVPPTAKVSPAGTPPARATSGAAKTAGNSSQQTNPKTGEGGVLAATAVVAPDAPKLPPVTDADGRLVLQIAATERSWVAIDADGNTVMQGVMDPNTVKTFKADTFFDVLTGNAQGVILTLNGQAQKPLGREGEVKQVHLTWKSLKNQTPE